MGSGARRFSVRAALFSAAMFMGIGIYVPFFPLWLAEKGMSGPEIATIIAAPLFVRIAFLPALAAFADRLPDLGTAAALYALVAALLLAPLAVFDGFWPILILSAGSLLFWNMLGPMSEAVILAGVTRHGLDYSRVRLWGSVGFIVASLLGAALLRRLPVDAVFVMILACFAFGIFAALALPRVSSRGVASEPFGLRRAFADPVLRRALIAGNLTLASHGAYYTFGSLYWQGQGLGDLTIGLLWAVSVIAEIVFFWCAKLLPAFGARSFIVAGAAGALLRWLLFPFALAPAAALALQVLHAASFAVTHLGVMMAIGAIVTPGHTGRLQATHQFVQGAMLAATTLAAGPLYRWAPPAAFWVMAALTLAALALAWQLPRGIQPQSSGIGGSTSAPA
jgi:PPP family 3-phenylpropionic acid transporter